MMRKFIPRGSMISKPISGCHNHHPAAVAAMRSVLSPTSVTTAQQAVDAAAAMYKDAATRRSMAQARPGTAYAAPGGHPVSHAATAAPDGSTAFIRPTATPQVKPYLPLTVSGNIFDLRAEVILRNQATKYDLTHCPYWLSITDIGLLGGRLLPRALRAMIPVEGRGSKSHVVVNAAHTTLPAKLLSSGDACETHSLPLDIRGNRYSPRLTTALRAAAKAKGIASPYWFTAAQLDELQKAAAYIHQPFADVQLREGAEGTKIGIEQFFNASETTRPDAFHPGSCTNHVPQGLHGGALPTSADLSPEALQMMTASVKRAGLPSTVWVSSTELEELDGKPLPSAVGVTPSASASTASPTTWFNAAQTTVATRIQAERESAWSHAQSMLNDGLVPRDGQGKAFRHAADLAALCRFASHRLMKSCVFLTTKDIETFGLEIAEEEKSRGTTLPSSGVCVYNTEQTTNPDKATFCTGYLPVHGGTRERFFGAERGKLAQVAFENGIRSPVWVPIQMLQIADVPVKPLEGRSTAIVDMPTQSVWWAARDGTQPEMSPVAPSTRGPEAPGAQRVNHDDDLLFDSMVNASQTEDPARVEAMLSRVPRSANGSSYGRKLRSTWKMRAIAVAKNYPADVWVAHQTFTLAGTELRSFDPAPPHVRLPNGYLVFNIGEARDVGKMEAYLASQRTADLNAAASATASPEDTAVLTHAMQSIAHEKPAVASPPHEHDAVCDLSRNIRDNAETENAVGDVTSVGTEVDESSPSFSSTPSTFSWMDDLVDDEK